MLEQIIVQVNAAMRSQSMSAAALAKACKINEGNLSRLLTGKTTNAETDTLNKLYDALGLAPEIRLLPKGVVEKYAEDKLEEVVALIKASQHIRDAIDGEGAPVQIPIWFNSPAESVHCTTYICRCLAELYPSAADKLLILPRIRA